MKYERVAVITANLGDFDKEKDPVEQTVPFDFYRFTDENFKWRNRAMTSRLQARIVKTFGWQMVPEHQFYLWVDSSCQLSHPDSVKWFYDQMGMNDVVVFKHPNRNTIGEEEQYLKKRLANHCPYLTPRYENELLDEQMAEINDPNLPLYASTAFMYRNTYDVKKMLKEWWYHISRYHTIDQLSFPHVLKNLKVGVIPDSYLKTPYLKYVR